MESAFLKLASERFSVRNFSSEPLKDEDLDIILEAAKVAPTAVNFLAWKMPGAGGGGYLALVVDDAAGWAKEHKEAIRITIRR